MVSSAFKVEESPQMSGPEQRARTILYTAMLAPITAALVRAGIPHAFYKGPIIAAQLYQSSLHRTYGDLDLFIRADDYYRARTALSEIGFLPIAPRASHEERWERYTQDAIELKHNETGVPLDLHWELEQRFFLGPRSLGRLWSGIRQIEIAGVQVPTFSDEALLLVLVAHGTKHFWSEERWITDVTKLVSGRQLNWEQVCTGARELGLERQLGVALKIAERENHLPDHLRDQFVAEPEVVNLTAECLSILTGGTIGPFGGALLGCRFRSGVAAKLNYIFGRLTVPFGEDFEKRSLSARAFPLHFVYKPIKVIYNAIAARFTEPAPGPYSKAH